MEKCSIQGAIDKGCCNFETDHNLSNRCPTVFFFFVAVIETLYSSLQYHSQQSMSIIF
jgi:hypothetical protein